MWRTGYRVNCFTYMCITFCLLSLRAILIKIFSQSLNIIIVRKRLWGLISFSYLCYLMKVKTSNVIGAQIIEFLHQSCHFYIANLQLKALKISKRIICLCSVIRDFSFNTCFIIFVLFTVEILLYTSWSRTAALYHSRGIHNKCWNADWT